MEKHRKEEQKSKMKRRATDEEDFLKTQRKEGQKSKAKRKAIDEDGFLETHRREEQKSMMKRKAADEEGFLETQRKKGQKSKAKRRATDVMVFKKQQKTANQKYCRKIGSSQDAAVRKFFQETLHGPNFVCVCCRTLNFRHNVVIYDGKARVEIRKNANEAHEQEYNSELKQV